MNTQTYVLGFLFSDSMRYVALITKEKPKWQRGLLNGIGGKVEMGESPPAAMEREFYEEAGVRINNWNAFCEMVFEGSCRVYVFSAMSSTDLVKVKTKTSEQVSIVNWDSNEFQTISNLAWLVPMARESLMAKIEARVYHAKSP